ncbi:slightly ste11-like protein [Paramarasmius palmivorus]|uniref:Slightly ste11-like protein n=1 Tax=Paramarasmius palmivorus TaxID=297713 RepID=A0AAW0CSG7_9AGAR
MVALEEFSSVSALASHPVDVSYHADVSSIASISDFLRRLPLEVLETVAFHFVVQKYINSDANGEPDQLEYNHPHCPSEPDHAPKDPEDAHESDSGTMFSRNSGVSISGGQFNNVSGDQVHIASSSSSSCSSFYVLGIPQSIPTIQFKDGELVPDFAPYLIQIASTVDVDQSWILGTSMRWLSHQLSQIGSINIDMDVSQFGQLVLLLAYHSFEPQITRFIAEAPLLL